MVATASGLEFSQAETAEPECWVMKIAATRKHSFKPINYEFQ